MTEAAKGEAGANPADLMVRDHGAVRYLALNRPESKNGLTDEVLGALIAAVDGAGRDEAIRVVLLTGVGGSFSSGADLRAGMALAGKGPQALEEHLRTYFHGAIRALRRLDKPVVALLDGPAVGFGCDLALACDLRVGTRRARFGEIFVKRGLMPDGGGTFTLPRVVGVAKALEMMLTGDSVEAEEALRLGLLNRIVLDEAEALSFAARLAQGPPLVHRHVKRAVYEGLSGTLETSLDREARGQLELMQSQDFAEGVSAFFMKRPPIFTGK